MNNTKLFLGLAIIMAVGIAPISGAFAQSDVAPENTEKQIDKEKQKQFHDKLKEKRLQLRDQLHNFNDQRKDRLSYDERQHVEPTVTFEGITSGWAVIDGKAFPAEFVLDGKAGQTDRGWQLTGTGTVFVGDREITFDLKGITKNHHIGIKGISQNDESIVIHLRGNFAPIGDSEDSFALAFKHGAIMVSESDLKVPLVLVGSVTVKPIISDVSVDDTTIEEDLEQLDEMLAQLT